MPVSGLVFKFHEGIGRVQRELMHAFFSGLGCGSSSGNALYSGIPPYRTATCALKIRRCCDVLPHGQLGDIALGLT